MKGRENLFCDGDPALSALLTCCSNVERKRKCALPANGIFCTSNGAPPGAYTGPLESSDLRNAESTFTSFVRRDLFFVQVIECCLNLLCGVYHAV